MSFNQSVESAFTNGVNAYTPQTTPSNGSDLPKATWNNHVQSNYGSTRQPNWNHTQTMRTLSKTWFDKNR